MVSATAAAEHIPNEEGVSRLCDWPSMYEDSGRGSIAANLFFTFPEGQSESLVWRKYAPEEADVHALGCQRETVKRARNPQARYTGCRTSKAGTIRDFRSARGHGFTITHEPIEGIHHAAVAYLPAGGATVDTLKKGEKGELKLALSNLFGPLSPHTCPQEA